MSDPPDPRAGLSPAKRRLLDKWLSEKREGDVLVLPRAGKYALSPAQERLWFLHRLEPSSPALHLAGVCEINGTLDAVALHAAFIQVVARHDVLRATFRDHDGRPSMMVSDAPAVCWDALDLRAEPPSAREARWIDLKDRVALEPFSLEEGPLVRGALARMDEERWFLATCAHHIVSDGLSMGLFFEDLQRAYAMALEGSDLALPPLALQYQDYAAWQRRSLDGPWGVAHAGYWKQKLEGAPPLDFLGSARGSRGLGPLVQRPRRDLPTALKPALLAAARALGVTPFMFGLAAFKALLYRLSGQPDITVGSPVSGRVRPEFTPLVGFFVNTLVLRTSLHGGPSFRELLGRVKTTCLEAYEHQEFPFERVVELLNPERHLDRNPLFQVMFNYVDFNVLHRTLPGATLEYASRSTGTQLDFTLFLFAGRDTFHVEAEFEASVLDAGAASTLLDRYAQLLQAAVSAPETPCTELPLFVPADSSLCERAWRGPLAQDHPPTLGTAFREQAARTPYRSAVVCGSKTMTYGELENEALLVAAGLRSRGVGKGDLVAVDLARGPLVVVALLGVSLAGAAYVPLGSTLPERRRMFMLEDSGAALVLGDLPHEDAHHATLEELSDPRAEIGVLPTVTPSDLAYVIYTSGSTGEPKGVRISHGALMNLLRSMIDRPGLTAEDGLLAVTSLSFDIAGFELFGPLLVGGTVHLATEEDARDGRRLSMLLEAKSISVMQATPSTWRLLLAAGWPGKPGLRALSGGEPLPQELADHLRRRVLELWNLYGPTETTVWSTCGRVDGPVHLGTPLAGTVLRVVDRDLRPVPPGVAGELLIGGVGVALGYWRRDELTAQRFLTDLLAADLPGARRWYRTGDLVKLQDDGSMEFLGRADDQVKLRGHRIELGDVATTLERHPAVREAVAGVVEDARGDPSLWAWVITRKDVSDELLSSWLREHLPLAMLPSGITRVTAFALTPNGKLDRGALPKPTLPSKGSFLGPKNPLEQAVAEIFEEVLGVSRLGVRDDFFALGGHSLLATRLASRIEARLGFDVPLRTFFEAPTIAGLVASLNARSARDADPTLRPTRRGARTAPQSFAQERLWFLEHLSPGRSAYTVPALMEIRGPLDVSALRAAIEDLIVRHEALRTVFFEEGGRALSRVLECAELAWMLEEGGDVLDASQEFDAAFARALSVPWNLRLGPLVRVHLWTPSAGRHLLLFLQHHMVTDGWSLGVLLRELLVAYRARRDGRAPTWSSLVIQSGDLAAWQREVAARGHFEREVSWWVSHLKGAPPFLDLPSDHPRPPLPSGRGRRCAHVLPDDLARQARQFGQDHASTLFVTLLAAFKIFLWRLSLERDVVVGTTVAERPTPETESVVGLLVNTLALRTQLDPRESFEATVARVRETVWSGLEHAAAPFEQVVLAVSPTRDLSRSPLFQVSFDLWSPPSPPEDLDGLDVAFLDVDAGTAKFDVTVQVVDREDLTLVFEAATDLFEPATVESWSRSFQTLLRAALTEPRAEIATLPLAEKIDREQQAREDAATETPWPPGTVWDLFERQVACTPEATALEDHEGSHSFREIAARAASLARELGNEGVVPGSLVGICLPRTADLIVAVLGVLRARAVYVPLDPRDPPARRRFIEERSGMDLLLTEEPPSSPRVRGCRVTKAAGSGEPVAPVRAASAGPGVGGVSRSDELAYVIYTSGSTGMPKGVEVTHEGLLNYIAWAAATYPTEGGAPLHTSLSFDLTVTSVLVPLVTGASVVLLDEELGLEPLLRTLEGERTFGFVKLTPTHLKALTPFVSATRAKTWSRSLIVGGEALDGSALLFWQRHAPSVRIFNEYGPTETVVGCSVYEVPAGAPWRGPVPLGNPIANTWFRVVDSEGNRVPPGIPGELWVGGSGVARGYLGRRDLTEEWFVPDPCHAGRRFYRTGDRVVERRVGLIYLGRLDDQVKIRGHRVEPLEVEARLRDVGWLRDAFVGTREFQGLTQLVAWVVARDGGDVTTLSRALAESLPSAWIPSHFISLEVLPRTPHGKVDRALLPDPRVVDDGAPVKGESPYGDSPTECLVASVMARVLGLDGVSAHRGFFEMGGDSILSIQLVAALREAGLFVTTRQVFEYPTAAGLASVAGRAPHVEAEQGLVVGPLALTPIQRWFFSLEVPQRSHWNQGVVLEVASLVDEGALRRAFVLLLEHHDALRHRFVQISARWHQEAATSPSFAWFAEDVASDEELFASIPAFAARVQQGLDLREGPLVLAHLVRSRASGRRLLIWIVHHLVVDGVSWRILIEDLPRAYADATSGGTGGALPRKTSSFRAWSAWLEQVRASGSETPKPTEGVVPFPRDRDGGLNLQGSVVVLEGCLDIATTGALLLASRRGKSSLEELLLAALARALGRDTPTWVEREGFGRPDVPDLDLGRTVGWFTTIHLLCLPAAWSSEAAASALKEVKRSLRGEASGFESSQESLARDVAAHGFHTDVLVNFHGTLDASGAKSALFSPVDLDLGPLKDPKSIRSHALEITSWIAKGQWHVRWEFSENLHERPPMERRLAELLRALEDLSSCTHPEASWIPSDFPLAMVGDEELSHLLESHPTLEDLYPLSWTQQGMLFHRLLEPASRAYFEQAINVLEGPLDREALRDAMSSVVRRHDLFHAAVAWKGLAEPHLVVVSDGGLPWEDLDWSGLKEKELLPRLSEFAEGDRARAFDLESAPLHRTTLIRLGEQRHALVFSYHHIILDGWSLPLVAREILDAYERRCAKEALTSDPAPPYRDYVRWLRRQDQDASREFFRARLSGFAVPQHVEGEGGLGEGPEEYLETEVVLDARTTSYVQHAARRLGITLSTLVHASWGVLLSHLTGDADVVFGSTVSGRSPDVSDISRRVGLFINTVPVRVALPLADASEEAWLRDLQRDLGAQSIHETTPLMVSQAQSDVPKGRPLFETLVVFENYPVDPSSQAPASGLVPKESFTFERTSYALTVVAVPGERLTLRLIFDARRFGNVWARRVVRRLQWRLLAMARAGSGPLRTLMRGEEARLASWSAGSELVDSPGLESVPAWFRRVALGSPTKVALQDGERLQSYGELLQVSDGIARGLVQRGVRPGALVAWAMDRSAEAIASFWGILRAGAVWFPLDSAWPEARWRLLLDEHQPVLVLTSDSLAHRVLGRPVWILPSVAELLQAPVPDAVSELVTLDDPAYVISTSGSTGTPKGVVVGHRALARYSANAISRYELHSDDRVLQFAALTFDTCLEEIVPTLLAGATLVLRQDAMVASGRAFARAVEEERLTVLNFPTAWWHELVGTLEQGAAAKLSGVRLVILGGEAVRPAVLARWFDLMGRTCRLENTYGPTETTVVVTSVDLAREPDRERIPIGRPWPGVFAGVFGMQGELLPIGTPGELCLGGDQLAREYRKRPELTSEKFVIRGVSHRSVRLFRTGDRVRWRRDGQLEFLGRRDDQVKVQGYRVELQEVERCLASAQGVLDAAVVARLSATGVMELAAFLESTSSVSLTVHDVRRHAVEHLPPPMVPRRITILSSLPRLVSGKVDRGALPLSERSRPDLEAVFSAPRTPEETSVTGLLAELLDVERVGIHDDFFALGGNSLVAVRFLTEVARRVGVELSLRDLFDGPTPAELARVIALLERGDPRPEVRRPWDLISESTLDQELRPVAASAPWGRWERVLLTGATGFLGSVLLAELLRAGVGAVVCLVRARDVAEGRARVLATLERYGLAVLDAASRIEIVPGALDSPSLGLSEAELLTLGCQVDAVYHCGASTSFFLPYGALRGPNVLGTLEILRLCCSRGLPLHFVSTIGVFAKRDLSGVTALREDAELLDFADVSGGYVESKWVAERLVQQAADRGLPVTIFRPGRITAHSQSGAWNPDDFATRTWGLCLEMGCLPDLSDPLDASSVDYVARAIVHLSRRADASGRVFHLVNPKPVRVREVWTFLSRHGVKLELVPLEAWQQKLRETVGRDPQSPHYPLLPLLLPPPGQPNPPTYSPAVDMTNTLAGLAGTTISCPAVEEALLEVWLQHFMRTGLISGNPDD